MYIVIKHIVVTRINTRSEDAVRFAILNDLEVDIVARGARLHCQAAAINTLLMARDNM